MNKLGKILIVAALVVAVGLVIVAKLNVSSPSSRDNTRQTKPLPRLVDLGSDNCIPCKMMAHILEELKKEYVETLQVDFFDVHKNPAMAEKYEVMIIPTQIFFDASGKELFRHEGFMSKQDILAKWKELGVELEKAR